MIPYPYIIVLAAAGIIMLLGGLFILLFIDTRNIPAKIQGFFWKRTISYEKKIWVSETSESGFPPGYRNGSTSKTPKMVNKVIEVEKKTEKGTEIIKPK